MELNELLDLADRLLCPRVVELDQSVRKLGCAGLGLFTDLTAERCLSAPLGHLPCSRYRSFRAASSRWAISLGFLLLR